MEKSFRLIWVSFLLCLCVRAGDDAVARQSWDKAYRVLELAELAEREGHTAEALNGFVQAMAGFRKLEDSCPEWNAQMVSSRISYCRGRLLALGEQLMPAYGKMDAEELRLCLKASYAGMTMLMKENDALREKIIAGKNAPARENSALQKEIEVLQEALRRSELRKNAWQQAAIGAEKARQALTDELMNNDELRSRLKAKEQAMAELDSKTRKLVKQLENVEKWTKAPPETAGKMLEKELGELEKELAKRDAELTAFRTPEALRKQGQMERGELMKLAAEHEAAGDLATVARCWACIAIMAPEDAMAALRAAVWFSRMNLKNEAQHWANQFFQRSFTDAMSLSSLAGELLQMGEMEHALALAAWASALAPEMPEPHYVLAGAYVALRDLPAAEAQYRQVLVANPNHTPSLAALATIYATTNRLREAHDCYQLARVSGAEQDKKLEEAIGWKE